MGADLLGDHLVKKKGLKDKLKIYKKSCTADLFVYDPNIFFFITKKNYQIKCKLSLLSLPIKKTICVWSLLYVYRDVKHFVKL